MSAVVSTNHKPRTTNILVRLFQSEYLILILCATYFAALAPFTPGFASTGNLANILSAMLPLLVVATGLTLVLITAGIDLSVTSIIALASVVGAMLINGDSGLLAGSAAATPAGVLVMLAIGGFIGLLNGAVITLFRMPPFIVTLTGMMFFSGLAIWLTESKSIASLPPSFLALGKNPWLAGCIAAVVAIVGHLLLTRTLPGRWLYAVGHNPKAALISGVPVNRTLILAYVACGLCAGVAAVLITGRLESGSPVHWRNNLLDIIGATVIGGTSLYGGRGKVLWTVFGVLFLTLIDNSLNLLNLSHFSIMMVKGGVILAAAVLDAVRNRMLVVSG
jgi:ribose/xylose/arabinose/galactoside ABC-type transport system permease subunit